MSSDNDVRERILGRWYGKLDGEPVAVEFAPDGRLALVILHGGRRQTIILTYRFDGDDLITDQPSQPREERTRVEFEGNDLILDLQGRKTRLSR